MNQLSITEIRQVELCLLNKFKSFCTDNDIKYFLSNGTLLGAVKYKGFIPWDDDIDLFVPRDDYNRLVKCFKDDEQIQLFSFERNKDFRFPFAKLCDMSTVKCEHNTNNGLQLGLDIDIFPLDAWDNDFKAAQKELKKIRKNMNRLDLVKLNKAESVNPIKRFIKSVVMLVYKVFGSKRLIKKIISEAADNNPAALYLGCKTWPIYGEREIIPSNVFLHTIEVEFEGGSFPAPIGYDVYLRSLYGDYEDDPPAEKQKTHHLFMAYRK